MSKKTGHVPATFSDAGTGETFEGGKDHLIEDGAYANYEAAGLVHEPAPKKAGTAAKPRSKATARKSAARAPAPKPSSAAVTEATADPLPPT